MPITRTYTNQRDLAKTIRNCLLHARSKSYDENIGKRLEGIQDAKEYITSLFDIDENRLLVFKNGSAGGIFRNTLFSARRTRGENMKIFIDALLNHDKDTYTSLLADLIDEYQNEYGESKK
jgi:hypothetical protein